MQYEIFFRKYSLPRYVKQLKTVQDIHFEFRDAGMVSYSVGFIRNPVNPHCPDTQCRGWTPRNLF